MGGAIENSIDRPLNWAVYFCDFLRYQTPLPDGESALASDANVSYKRTALQAIQPVWRDVFHETSVNAALRARGIPPSAQVLNGIAHVQGTEFLLTGKDWPKTFRVRLRQ